MNIKQLSRTGGIVLGVVLALAALVTAFSINQIRFGGEMDRHDSQINEFKADILPPPEYLVESDLIANVLVREQFRLDERSEERTLPQAEDESIYMPLRRGSARSAQQNRPLPARSPAGSRASAPAPKARPVSGNLALKAEPDDQDWSEF